jgi:hypothetical protein
LISTVVTPSAASAASRGRLCATSSSSIAARVARTVALMPPPRLRDLRVRRAALPRFELAHPVAGVDEMRVAIDEAGRRPRAGSMQKPLRRGAARQVALGADPRDTSARIPSAPSRIVRHTVRRSPPSSRDARR